MNKKEKLQSKIAKYQAELHDIEVKDWWLARPHIAEFECSYNRELTDDGDLDNYFNPHTLILNHMWIKYNGIEWQTFCNHNNIPLYPDQHQLNNKWESYMYSIKNLNDYECDYPEFVRYDGLTMVNPNIYSTVDTVCEF